MTPIRPCSIRICVVFVGSLLVFALLSGDYRIGIIQSQSNPREGWAILLEMNDYPEQMNNLSTGYSDTAKWNATLRTLGWQLHHMWFFLGFLDQRVGQTALQFLVINADANDVVLFFIFAHGNWIRDHMQWNSWFPTLWAGLQSQEKLLIVSACNSEALIEPMVNDSAPHIHIAATQKDGGYAWAGLPDEGLPIIGEVFNHYFTDALVNVSADQNGDGEICVEEAFAFASPLSQNYITTVVFPAYPDYAQMCNNTAPYPVIDDAYPGNFSMKVEDGDPPVVPGGWMSLEVGFFLFILTCVIVLVLGLFIRYRHRITN